MNVSRDLPLDQRMAFATALVQIPDNQKSAYLEVLAKEPLLVSFESNPRFFLEFENYNYAAAAQRLVAFWQARKIVFGDRAFLPMNATGQGALTESDVALLHTNYLLLCPHGHTDGGNAMVYSPAFVDPEAPGRIRCCFYQLFVMMQDEGTRRSGFHGITVLDEAGLVSAHGRPEPAYLIRTCFPIRLATGLILHSLCEKSLSRLKSEFMSKYARLYRQLCLQSLSDFMLTLNSDNNDTGFNRSNLPYLVGGGLKLGDLGGPSVTRNPDSTHEGDAASLTPYAPQSNANLTAVEIELIENERLVRRRRLNNEASRRKRAKVKERHQSLRNCLDTGQKINRYLRSENQRLTNLVNQAMAIARQLNS